MTNTNTNSNNETTDFIRALIKKDISDGIHNKIVTRFPPEPNGYLHIGHAAAICLNFQISHEFENSYCNLRFDDTNPSKESIDFVRVIKADIKWLGFDWGSKELYASDYFPQLFDYANQLIEMGDAYVDSQSAQQITENRGTLKSPGKNSKFRTRSIQENLDLFDHMQKGEFQPGDHVLRAKIDMQSPNMNMRDPVMYRILNEKHHQTSTSWCIYPMYDFAHGLCDSIEKVTHSLCTLEYEDHRPLYNWFIEKLKVFPSRQIEFEKLMLSHTILSKRNLLKLVESKHVNGWDDPRMPTIAGMRRLGYTPESIKNFCSRVRVTKRANITEIELLEHCLREDLNKKAKRVLAVLNPIKITIINYPENHTEYFEAINNPQDDNPEVRQIPFSRTIHIEKDDFMIDPPSKFFRLSLGREVRLRYAYIIKCHEVVTDPNTGEISEIKCTYDPDTRGGQTLDGRKVKGTIHWVSKKHAIQAQIRLYDRLCIDTNPDISAETNLSEILNPASLTIIETAQLEPSLANSKPGDKFQFERLGYFCLDTKDSSDTKLVFNRAATLKDTWNKRNSSNLK